MKENKAEQHMYKMIKKPEKIQSRLRQKKQKQQQQQQQQQQQKCGQKT